eukprot:TRINITY_DN14001_c0_g1_i1.p1 TRINITY_DN14001_c0_g1~~TRINITY_DN14001_c0_g1_i1.p1  ORF type:complete len:361 (-),score=83.66 TRINITY_DN14001_c0_g1_i1:198-1280(-)
MERYAVPVLPDDVICEIITRLPNKERFRIRIVCQSWRLLADSCIAELLWKDVSRPVMDCITVAKRLSHLRSLVLMCHQITPTEVYQLTSTLQCLTSFSLDCFTGDDDHIASVLRECVHLTHLALRCEQVSAKLFVRLPQLLPRLEALDVSWCSLSDDILPPLVAYGSQLRTLVLSDVGSTRDASLMQVLSVCTALMTLNVAECQKLTNACVRSIAALPRLQTLVLDGCRGITALNELVDQTPAASSLTDLSLAELSHVDMPFLLTLSYYCTNLTALNVSSCRKASFRALVPVLTTLPSLTSLDIRNSFTSLQDLNAMKLIEKVLSMPLAERVDAVSAYVAQMSAPPVKIAPRRTSRRHRN